VVDGGTTSEPRVAKGHNFQVGDSIVISGSETAVTISAIDTSNDSYDILTLSAEVADLAAGSVLVESAAYMPNAVLGSDLYIDGKGLPTLDAAYDAVVLKNIIGAVPDAWLQGIALKNNPNIIYINQ